MSTVAAQTTLLTKAPSIILRVLNPDGSYAGTETHRSLPGRGLSAGHLIEWDLLDPPVDYYACHHLDT